MNRPSPESLPLSWEPWRLCYCSQSGGTAFIQATGSPFLSLVNNDKDLSISILGAECRRGMTPCLQLWTTLRKRALFGFKTSVWFSMDFNEYHLYAKTYKCEPGEHCSQCYSVSQYENVALKWFSSQKWYGSLCWQECHVRSFRWHGCTVLRSGEVEI